MICCVEKCCGDVIAKGLCRKHYSRMRRHGDPNTVIQRKDYVRSGDNHPNFKHGLWNKKIYHVWRQMKSRCENVKDKSYPRYGAKGVTVCDRWHDINNFINDMGTPKKGDTIDRINSNGIYEPSNCRWADYKTQSRNRSCVKLTQEDVNTIRSLKRRCRNGKGDGYTRKEIADMYGVSVSVIKNVLSGRTWT